MLVVVLAMALRRCGVGVGVGVGVGIGIGIGVGVGTYQDNDPAIGPLASIRAHGRAQVQEVIRHGGTLCG